MSWGYRYYTKPPLASQQRQAAKREKELKRELGELQPIIIEGGKIAKTWWGMAWNKNLESYADFQNRLGRGRSYCKNGLILDLRVDKGEIAARVSGSSIYMVVIRIDKLSDKKWQAVCTACAKRVESIGALAEGRFPHELADVFMKQGEGLFPSPREIRMSCSCPDSARLDADPLLFFKLRGVDPNELIKKSVEEKMRNLLANAGKKSGRVIADADADMARIFGV